jgi:predicted RNase H-like HicB family nuclease
VKDSDRYAKIVEWSEEDSCYVGTAPGLFDGGCHGNDPQAVFAELCDIVEEVVELYRVDGKDLPPPTTGDGLVKFLASKETAEAA